MRAREARSVMAEEDIRALLATAFDAARAATNAYLFAHPLDWYPCGFAWVNIDGRSPVVRALKKYYPEQQRGHKGYPKGWDVWNPSGSSTQSMDAKEAGARAFADVLTRAGFPASARSRMD